MKLIALVFLLALPVAGFSQTKLEFNETQADTIPNHIDSVLILGMGSTTTRIFLDELSEKFMKAFQSAHIASAYYYLGNDSATAKKELAERVQSKNYKTILTLFPKGALLFINTSGLRMGFVIPTTSMIPLPSPSTVISYSYSQSFDFKLYANSEKLTHFWTANIFIQGDLSRNRPTAKLSHNVIDSFEEHYYLP